MKDNATNSLPIENQATTPTQEEQKGFDLFLTRAKQLSKRVEGVPKHLGLLMITTLLSLVWFWFLVFSSSATWLQLTGALILLGIIIPLFFVYQLYSLSKAILSLPEKLIEFRLRILEEESFKAFALAEIKNRTDALNMFSILTELRAFLKASGGVAGLSNLLKLQFVKALNPFFSVTTLYSLAVCWLVSLLGIISFIVYLIRL